MLSEALSKKIENGYPYPLATVFRRLRTADPDRVGDEHALCGDVAEVAIKMLSLAALQDFRAKRALPNYLESFLGSMLHPSLGHYNELLRYIAAEDTTGMSFATAAAELYRGKLSTEVKTHAAAIQELLQTSLPLRTNKDLFDLLNVYRNKGKGHGASVSNDEYKQRVGHLLPVLLHLLQGLEFLERFEFFLVDEVRVTATGEFLHKLKVATGNHMEPRQLIRNEQLLPEHFYFSTSDSASGDVTFVDLHPFVISQVCKECKADQVFFFNDFRKKRLEFLSYSCGHHLYPGMLPSEFEQLLKVSLVSGEDDRDDGDNPNSVEKATELMARALERISAKDYVHALELLRASIGLAPGVDTYYNASLVAMAIGAPPTEIAFYLGSAEQLAPGTSKLKEVRAKLTTVFPESEQLREPLPTQVNLLRDYARSILEQNVYTPHVKTLLSCVTPKVFQGSHILFWSTLLAGSLVIRSLAGSRLAVPEVLLLQHLKFVLVMLTVSTSNLLASSMRDIYFALFNRVTSKGQPGFPDFYRTQLEATFGAFRDSGSLSHRLNWQHRGSRRYLQLVLMNIVLLIVGGPWLTAVGTDMSRREITFVAIDYLLIALVAAPAAPALYLASGIFREYSKLPLRAIVGAVGSASFDLVGRRILWLSVMWTGGFLALSAIGYISFSEHHAWLQLTLYYVMIFLGCLWTVLGPWSFSKALGKAKDQALQDYNMHVEDAFRTFLGAPDERSLERYNWLRKHQREVIGIRSSGLLAPTWTGFVITNLVILVVGISYPFAKFHVQLPTALSSWFDLLQHVHR